MQTQTSNTLHNAIMETGGKDRMPMLASGNCIQWKSRIKRDIDTKPNHELIHYCLKNPPYKFMWADKEVPISEVQIILTWIDDDIYSTVNACPNTYEMWKAIERLKHGESINVQDLETNLYWEFGKFTSQDGESLESYYSIFYKMMNELIRNQCDSQKLKTVSYHKLYDILKQYQNEVNEIRAERIARTANLLALVVQQQPVYHPQNHPTHYTQNSSTRSQQAATRNKGKVIANSPQPIYDQEPSRVAEDDEALKEKEINKLMALISLSFKKIYKTTNNNLRTSSNTSRANQDNSPKINKGAGYDNQRLGNVARARDPVGSTVVQKSGIQCYNCKEFRHVARECQKPKRVKDAAYHREKMLLSHYMYMAQIQEVYSNAADSGPIFDSEPVQKLVEIVLFIVDSRCLKHMTGNLKLLINFMEMFLGTVKFGNDQIAPILGYGDLVQGAVTIKRVYYVEGLNHNLFSVGSCGTNLYPITLQDTNSPNPICLMAKATSSQAWLWHRHLSHLNFDTINLLLKNDIVVGLLKLKFIKYHLCSSCELGKAKRQSFHTKTTPSSKRLLQLLHMDLCGPMRVASINGKRYVLVIVDDYSRYTWTYFLRSKDETPEVLIDFLKLVQRGLQAQVGVAEAIATACFTQNRSLVIPRHEKTPYHIINNRKPSVKFFHIFGSVCYIVRDGENLDKMKEKVMNVSSWDQLSSDPAPECQTMTSDQNSSDLAPE
nr:hypothetical protein [Tanacetum cinerariifolium]